MNRTSARARSNGQTPPVPVAGQTARRGRSASLASERPNREAIRIFLSHSTKYHDLARCLASSLESLQAQVPLEVLLCEEMQGGTDWLNWIDQEINKADILLLLYPHTNMDMAWCSYEKGRFDREHRSTRTVLCIKNVDIDKPPPVFEQYQAYDADKAGIRKFLSELFVQGDFSGGEPLNAAIDQVSTDYYKRANAAAEEIALHFSRARVKDLLFERRMAIFVDPQDEEAGSGLDHATVEGNEGGFGLFDVAAQSSIAWCGLRDRLKNAMQWPIDLENALPSIRSGLLPPSLSPFRASDGKIYLPVIPRTEMVAQKLRKIVIIFVAADSDNLRRMLDWLPPPAMPDSWVGLVRLMKLMVRARWEVLEPSFQEAKYGDPDATRCQTIAASVLTGLARLTADAQNQGFNGIARFRATYDVSMHGELDRVGEDFQVAVGNLRNGTVDDANDLALKLQQLLDNNGEWIQISAKQFMRLAGDLPSMIPRVDASA